MNKGTKKFLPLLLAGALTAGLCSRPAVADDDGKNGAATLSNAPKDGAAKPGLTERERWLLDRVEQLEKRVAELESKSQPALPVAAAADASAPLPGGTALATTAAETVTAVGPSGTSNPPPGPL